MGVFSFKSLVGEKIAEQQGGNVIYQTLMEKELEKHGLELRNPSIAKVGEVVTVSGEVDDQATREKIVLTLGNVKGVGQVEDNMTLVGGAEAVGSDAGAAPATAEAATVGAATAAAESTFYTVESGDTLSKIAKAHYGDAMKYPQIFEANKPMLSDPNKIYPGQVLRIPPQN